MSSYDFYRRVPRSPKAFQRKYISWFSDVTVSTLNGTIQADIIYVYLKTHSKGCLPLAACNVEYHRNRREARWSNGGCGSSPGVSVLIDIQWCTCSRRRQVLPLWWRHYSNSTAAGTWLLAAVTVVSESIILQLSHHHSGAGVSNVRDTSYRHVQILMLAVPGSFRYAALLTAQVCVHPHHNWCSVVGYKVQIRHTPSFFPCQLPFHYCSIVSYQPKHINP